MSTTKFKRYTKALINERNEIDYWGKLDELEKAWLNKFLLEYYQADFDKEGYLHPASNIKDCRDRNNASKRQLHSVGQDLLQKSAAKARQLQTKWVSRYYTPEDYPFKDDSYLDLEPEGDTDENT